MVIPVKPVQCPRCQHPLPEDDPQPQRHPVTEIPPVQQVVTEYQLHRLRCHAGGAATRAELPVGVPSGSFGPRVQAITALCTGAYHLSKRTRQSVREDLFGLPMSVGSMTNLEQASAEALAQPVAEARAYVQAQHAADLDETVWREGRAWAWLWTAVTSWVTVFVVRWSRSAKVPHKLLGERFRGYLVTDRWSAYTCYSAWRRQVCWAHPLRDIEAIIVRGGPSQAIGEAWRARACERFYWWHRVRDGTLTQASFAHDMRPIRREVERWLEVGQPCGGPTTGGVCREILVEIIMPTRKPRGRHLTRV